MLVLVISTLVTAIREEVVKITGTIDIIGVVEDVEDNKYLKINFTQILYI